jgi:hypothetical protein
LVGVYCIASLYLLLSTLSFTDGTELVSGLAPIRTVSPSYTLLMKHLYLVLLAGFSLLSAEASAQEAPVAFRSEAATATRQLAAFISLDDARQLPVRRLTQQRMTQEAEARQQYTNDPDMLQKKLTAIGQEYTAQLQQVLTPAQYQRYVAAGSGLLPASVAAVVVPLPAPATAVATTSSSARVSAPKAKTAAAPRPTTGPASRAAVRR